MLAQPLIDLSAILSRNDGTVFKLAYGIHKLICLVVFSLAILGQSLGTLVPVEYQTTLLRKSLYVVNRITGTAGNFVFFAVPELKSATDSTLVD